jgi:uncharacterized protein (TIRG00374 family)
VKRLIGLLVSAAIVAVIWWRVDLGAIVAAMRAADGLRLSLGIAFVIPLTIVTAWRFGLLTRTGLPVPASARLVLSASTLNLVLPSKMGDLAKALVLRNRYGFDGRLALALVVLEKAIDMAALLFGGVIALLIVADGPLLWLAALALAGLLATLLLLLSPLDIVPRALSWAAGFLPAKIGTAITGFSAHWAETTGWFWANRPRAALVWIVSLLLWAGHLVQIWLFAAALSASVPLVGSMAAATLAILAGLLPFTMAGIGTRDAALILLFAAWLSPAQGAALGVLATLRYLLPAIAGLPFVHDYWGAKRDALA